LSVQPSELIDPARRACEEEIFRLLTWSARRWRNRVNEALADVGQTDARHATLQVLRQASGGLIQFDLARRLNVSGATLVGILDALERQGLIARGALMGDRRANLIRLEDKGAALLDDLDRRVQDVRADLLSGQPLARLQATAEVLRDISGGLRPVERERRRPATGPGKRTGGGL
jgi:MarR family transcriptional regulator for hemolysin